MNLMRNMPNILSALRIAGAGCLPLFPPLSVGFFILYTLCGVSDMLDGFLARKLHAEMPFGARLDSAADLLFCAAAALKIVPILWKLLPPPLWYAAAVIVLLRAASYTLTAVKCRRFAPPHTVLNKIAGALVFAIPYSIPFPCFPFLCAAACAGAALSALDELRLQMHIGKTEH